MGEHKQSKFITSNSRMERTIVVLFSKQNYSLNSPDRADAQKYNAIVFSLEQDVKRILDDRIDNINNHLKLCIPYLKIEVVPYEDNAEVNLLKGTEKYINEFRLITILSDKVSYYINEAEFGNFSISHLVQINLDNVSLDKKSLVNACYKVHKDELAQRIADVLLDIAMFHSWFDEPNEDIKVDLQFRRNFSREKVLFMCNNSDRFNLSALQINENDSYCCFAFACYSDSGKFDYGQYENLWCSLVKKFITIDAEITGNFEKQINAYKYKNQLKINKLSNEFDKLSNGKYFLVITRKKPKNKRLREQIYCEMGFSQHKPWKTNKAKFIHMSEYARIARWVPFVTLYIINK